MMRVILLPFLGLLAATMQSIGKQGTCSHGDNGTLLVATLISLPFLVTVIGLVSVTAFSRQVSRSISMAIACVIVLAAMAWLLFDNFGLLQNIVWNKYTACGPDQGPRSREDFTIAFVYGLLPLGALITTVFVLCRMIMFSNRSER